MSVKVIIPTPLRPSLDNQDEISVEFEGSLQNFLLSLVEQYPKSMPYIFDDQKEVRKFVNFYVNDEDIRDLQSVDTILKSGDVISIVPSIAGGI